MTIIPTPIIDDMPTPAPSRDMTEDQFVPAVNATFAAFPTRISQMNAAGVAVETNAQAAETAATLSVSSQTAAAAAAAAAVGSSAFAATSNASLTLTAGAKTVALNETGKTLNITGALLVLKRLSDPNAALFATVQGGSTSTSLSLNVPSNGIVGTPGSGPYTDWFVTLADYCVPGTTSADILAGLSAFMAATPKALSDALAFLPLSDTSTIAWDTNLGVSAKLTLGANSHTMGAPTNLKDGWTYVLNINPATFALAGWNAIWDFGAAGAPVLPASSWSKVTAQYDAALNKLHASVRRGG